MIETSAPRRICPIPSPRFPGRSETRQRTNGTPFQVEDDWSVLRWVMKSSEADALHDQLGKPGLWKQVRDKGGRAQVFELPALGRMELMDELDEPALEPLEECLSWALATAQGKLPNGWSPPPRSVVETWVPAGGLTVQSGPLARQAELVHRPDRLALSCPILARVPEDLPPMRKSWLREVLLDAQNRWRMVRLGWAAPAGPIVAEVDLSGCPTSVLETVFQAGLAALRWVVQWLARSAAFLGNPAFPCRALEVCPLRG